jgi:hypothetical protein
MVMSPARNDVFSQDQDGPNLNLDLTRAFDTILQQYTLVIAIAGVALLLVIPLSCWHSDFLWLYARNQSLRDARCKIAVRSQPHDVSHISQLPQLHSQWLLQRESRTTLQQHSHYMLHERNACLLVEVKEMMKKGYDPHNLTKVIDCLLARAGLMVAWPFQQNQLRNAGGLGSMRDLQPL